jgi:superoxide dismutase, Fe-Mn family
MERREFLVSLGVTAGAIATAGSVAALPTTESTSTKTKGLYYPFALPKLKFQFSDFEPVIDKQTMEIHYSKHHQAYVTNLNQAFAKIPEIHTLSLEQVLSDLTVVPRSLVTTIVNHGGGHINHTLFWENLVPPNKREIKSKLAEGIKKSFSSFEEFTLSFEKLGVSHFGSGWVWLVANTDKKLELITTANQDSPYMKDKIPLLGNDLWEHAYYLKYQNRRAEYLSAWWSIVDWEEVNQKYLNSIKDS